MRSSISGAESVSTAEGRVTSAEVGSSIFKAISNISVSVGCVAAPTVGDGAGVVKAPTPERQRMSWAAKEAAIINGAIPAPGASPRWRLDAAMRDLALAGVFLFALADGLAILCGAR